MEQEIKKFMVVWLTAISSLTYCFVMSKFIPKGTARLCASIPIFLLFLYLPLILNSLTLVFIAFVLISWLANFRLLLFAFGRGPLSKPNLSFLGFLLLACLPIRIKQGHGERKSEEYQKFQFQKSTLICAVKTLLLSIICGLYLYIDSIHPRIAVLFTFVLIYLIVEPSFAIAAILARALPELELEPAFVDPYLATSLEDFWGKRWNLVVNGVLRQTIYEPLRSISRSLVGQRWAHVPAILATFLVSGLMHELLIYYMGRMEISWDSTRFYVLHGACVVVEIQIKKAVRGRFSFPRVVSSPLVILFVAFTNCEMWLLSTTKNEILQAKTQSDLTAMKEFVKKIIIYVQ